MSLNDYHLESKRKVIRVSCALLLSHTLIFLLCYTIFHQSPNPLPEIPNGYVPLKFDARVMTKNIGDHQEIAVIIDEKKQLYLRGFLIRILNQSSGFNQDSYDSIEAAIKGSELGLLLEALQSDQKPRVIPYLDNLNLHVNTREKKVSYEIHF